MTKFKSDEKWHKLKVIQIKKVTDNKKKVTQKWQYKKSDKLKKVTKFFKKVTQIKRNYIN